MKGVSRGRHRTRALTLALALALALASDALVLGVPRASADEPRSESSDLYMSRRPSSQTSAGTPAELEKMIQDKERQAARKRDEAIRLLEQFLKDHAKGPGAAEALFKLGELYWEDARRRFVDANIRYSVARERCQGKRDKTGARTQGSGCAAVGAPPNLDLSRAQNVYRRLLKEHPGYPKEDVVLYLLAFSLREESTEDAASGETESIALYQRLIKEYPESRLVPDAWMAIGEHVFAQQDFKGALPAYAHVLEHPDSPVYELALFKSAWCDWKLGNPDRAARRFKEVLDIASGRGVRGVAKTDTERKRRQSLREEALDYLVLVFTEDERVSAEDAYNFLTGINGKAYGREVLGKIAEAFSENAAYERAIQARRFLIGLDVMHPDSPTHQKAIVEAFQDQDEPAKAIAEMRKLAEDYGPGSAWAKANADRPRAVARAHAEAEILLRAVARKLHNEAQQDEKFRKKPDKERYGAAAEAYGFYLSKFPRFKDATELRFLRAEILYFKLEKYEEAGNEFMRIGRIKVVGPFHKDALLRAIASYEALRPKEAAPGTRRELTPIDRRFAEATDRYAELFPADPKIVAIIFKNGQLFLDAGDYDEAVKRFGLIVTKYPKDENAGAAGDRILAALARGKNYANVELWAKKLKSAPSFKAPDEQKKLDKFILDAVLKQGEVAVADQKYEVGAAHFLRAVKLAPLSDGAALALSNAGAAYEKARLPERAAVTYLSINDKYPRSPLAAKSAFIAAKLYEENAYFDRAAEAYEVVGKGNGEGDLPADATFNAGVLRQALGDPASAIALYEGYSKRFKGRKDADEVAFRVGVVYADGGDDDRAARTFMAYAAGHKTGIHAVEAYTRAGQAALKAGDDKLAATAADRALDRFRKLSRGDQADHIPWAAKARFLQGELVFREFSRAKLSVDPKTLQKSLEKKGELLEKTKIAFADVVSFGDADAGTAALLRVGEAYEGFANALKDTPAPPELTEDQQQEYTDVLLEFVTKIEQSALDAFQVGYAKAIELGVFNQNTRDLFRGLTRVNDQTYPPENENRSAARSGGRFAGASMDGLIEEIRRDE